jgi:hypothetical protein
VGRGSPAWPEAFDRIGRHLTAGTLTQAAVMAALELSHVAYHRELAAYRARPGITAATPTMEDPDSD